MTLSVWLGLGGAAGIALAWAVTLWRAFERGKRAEDVRWVERIKMAKADAFLAGQRAEAANREWIAESAEAARQATMTQNRRNGQLERHAKAKREGAPKV